VGVWLVWGPVTVAYAVSSDPVRAAALAGYGAGVLAVTDSYLRAILVDRGSGLHPAIALLGVIGGLSLFGFVGVFVGPAAFEAGVTVLNRLHRAELEGRGDRENRLAEANR
jgi:predicted PurR-regulated permease PerM